MGRMIDQLGGEYITGEDVGTTRASRSLFGLVILSGMDAPPDQWALWLTERRDGSDEFQRR